MSKYRSFFLGPIVSGTGNAFCGLGCGGETDRSTRFGVHVWDGSGQLRLACRDCAERYSELARFAWPTTRTPTLDELMRPRKPDKFVLMDVAEVEGPPIESVEVMPEIIEYEAIDVVTIE
jgi:hypothetical protein